MRILIIEDEKNIADIVAHNLRRDGFDTICAYDGEEGLEMALSEQCDLILLDVMLPKMDGWTVLRRLREHKVTPVIMLTAREEEQDKIMGLDLGADDYITKPFSMKELISRIRANLRRVDYAREGVKSGKVELGGLTIDNDRMQALKNGEPVELSNKEFSLLAYLVGHPGKVFTREQLLEEVWHYDGFYGDLRAVDVMVRRLREKLEEDPAEPRYIHTKRGQGYYFELA